MDEMIRALLSEPPPSTGATTDARRRLTDEIAGSRAARPSRTTWRRFAGVAVAAAVAVGIAAGSIAAIAPEGTRPGPTATAPELLLAAAHQAAAKPAGTGRYWRVQIVRKSGAGVRGRAGGETFDVGRRHVADVWQPRNPEDGTWLGSQNLGAYPWSATDRAAWERAGSPTEFETFVDPPTGARYVTLSTRPEAGRLQRVESGFRIEVFNLYDPFELARLPAEPDALRAAALDDLRRNGRDPGDLGVYVMMTELLTFAPATPELRAAAFTVLSRVPGVRNVGIREDATGRQGIGISYLADDWIILNPRDYTFLGFGSQATDGTPETATSMLKAEWTDSEPVPPALS
ncbi:CU044_5270 family protein [Actinoplanes auranticolor]|uniref:CU044_5270 family protein n=1 Tax=Actinoplanes auranticolor TaxID=47988 RepID=A0A919SU50_9ACTN|nr:CU044_5270 family protein [Actinoplanes auranticolor]GIM77108.1 hypothetical protein Aau02nite_74210 [Actinoplanes auranticolor]